MKFKKKIFAAALIFFVFAASQDIVAQDDKEEKTCVQTYLEAKKECHLDHGKKFQDMTAKEARAVQESAPIEDCFSEAVDRYDSCVDDMGETDEDVRGELDGKREEKMEECLEKWTEPYEEYIEEWNDATTECCESRFIHSPDLCDMIRYLPPDDIPENMARRRNILAPRFNMCVATKMRQLNLKLVKCRRDYDGCADKAIHRHFKKIKRAIEK
jgi:hypothetical protein